MTLVPKREPARALHSGHRHHSSHLRWPMAELRISPLPLRVVPASRYRRSLGDGFACPFALFFTVVKAPFPSQSLPARITGIPLKAWSRGLLSPTNLPCMGLFFKKMVPPTLARSKGKLAKRTQFQ